MTSPLRAGQVIGVAGFRASSGGYYSANSPAGLRGSVAMTRVLVLSLFRKPTAAAQVIWTTSTNPNSQGGWRFRFNAGALIWAVSSGVTTEAVLTISTLAFQYTPQPLICIFSHDGANLRCWINGYEQSQACVGYTSSNNLYVVGANQSGGANPLLDASILALLGSDTVALTTTQQFNTAGAAIAAALRNQQYITPASGYDGSYLDARDAPIDGATTWADRINTANNVARTGNRLQYTATPISL
jgi:hypothetical protein